MTFSEVVPTRVVLCDDHLVLAQGLTAMLATELDIVVVGIAGSVAEVIEMVDSRRPDVVLIDYGLPDGDGVDATRMLKAAHPELQVVMLTSYTSQEILIGAMEAGCSGYITKHSGASMVAVAIRQAAAGEAIITTSLLYQLLPRLEPTYRGVGANLTARELEILELLADGTTGRAIAERLYLSFNTVRNHVQSILDKLGAHSQLQAVAIAVKEGIVHRS
jgi:DNA-binding NarL/FixJ family response regulator